MEEEGSSDEDSSTDSQDEDDAEDDQVPWMNAEHRGGRLPGVVRRRLVPTVSARERRMLNA